VALGGLLAWSLANGCDHLLVSSSDDRDANSVVQHSGDPSPRKREGWLRQLVIKKDVTSLLSIADSDDPEASLAAYYLVTALEPNAAITFCRRTDLGSPKWSHAFAGLKGHPREAVIEYVKQMSGNPLQSVRCASYLLCLQAEWPDVAEAASEDLGDATPIGLINQASDEMTVGQVARKYLTWVASRPDASRPRRGLGSDCP
jgi:hypothetical protein